MATYVEVKIIFDFLSKIEISRFSDFQNLIFNRIINRGPCCYNWCWKQHSIIVAHCQQKCCFSATSVYFLGFCTFIQVKIEIWMKKQHLLPKNNTFVENHQQWCYVALYIIYSIMTLRKSSICFAQFFDSCFWWIPEEFTKENEKWISLVNPPGI